MSITLDPGAIQPSSTALASSTGTAAFGSSTGCSPSACQSRSHLSSLWRCTLNRRTILVAEQRADAADRLEVAAAAQREHRPARGERLVHGEIEPFFATFKAGAVERALAVFER